MITREKIAFVLKEALVQQDFIDAAFLSGSAAFGRMDAYSDLDVRIVANLSNANRILQVVTMALRSLAPIEHRYQAAARAGVVQCFYTLEGASPFHMVDLAVIDESELKPLLDPARHGRPSVWFDRKGLLKLEVDRSCHDRLAARRKDLPQVFKLFGRVLVERACLRGRFAEAVYHYHQRVLGPLVEYLRSYHCPERQDYGVRYLEWDIPREDRIRLDTLYSVTSLDEILRGVEVAEEWFSEIELSLKEQVVMCEGEEEGHKAPRIGV